MATIIHDQYANTPNEKVLDFIVAGRNAGASAAGMYCGYTPVELVRAVGAVPVFLCAFSSKTIAAAGIILPVNLCPLIMRHEGLYHRNRIKYRQPCCSARTGIPEDSLFLYDS